jgi:uncharacterized iron-regulated membrane protein
MNRLLQRATWLKVHLYLALLIGFFFALMGLTGSVSVYREAIDEFLNPQLVIENPAGQRQSLDKIMLAVQNAHPDLTGAWTLEMPRTPHSMLTAWYDKPSKTFFEFYAPLMVSVNPYTAEVVTSRYWGQTFTTWLLDLHTQLRLDKFGWNVIGLFGVLLMVSVSTGVYLWWSDARRLLQAFTVRHNAGLMRLLFDVHRLLGLVIAPALLVLAFTGIQLSYPEVLESIVGASGMEHGETGRTIISTARPNKNPTGLESAEFIARAGFPRSELRRVTTPSGDTGIYRINLRQPSEINQRHPFTTVWVDRWSGQIKEVRNPATFSTGETMLEWLWPLHTGEALGTLGRFVWFLAGLSVCFLYVTGVMHWLYRHGKIKDRTVDISTLRPLAERAEQGFYRFAVALLTVSILAGRWAMPHLKTGYTLLLQWVKRGVAKLRK